MSVVRGRLLPDVQHQSLVLAVKSAVAVMAASVAVEKPAVFVVVVVVVVARVVW